MDFFNDLKPVIFMLLAVGVILGLLSPRKAIGRILAMVILVPMAVGIGGGYLKTFVENAATPADFAILLAGVLLVIIVLLRILLGKEIFTHIIGNFIYDILKESFFMFFRLLGRLGRFLSGGAPR
jgi:hypothetical protein